MSRILVIEDDELIAALERDFLQNNGFEVTVAREGRPGLRALEQMAIDAVVLDVHLPDVSGFSLCRAIREKYDIPIIFVTASGSDEDQIKGLGLGADDYIVKPFNPSVMVARVKAHMAMHEHLLAGAHLTKDEAVPDIQSGDMRIYIRRRQVFRGQTEIPLTGKEFNLLLYLAQHPNQVLSKKELFEKIWHLDALGEMATVTVHVNRLRDKMNLVEPEFTAIETVWGNGYRFRLEN